MATQNETLLELRLGELELEVHRLRRQVQKLESTPKPATLAPAKAYTHPTERATIHEKRGYEFFAKLPPVRKVIDFRTTNTATNEALRIDGYSSAQIERACQQFSRLQFLSRRHWKGNRWLYGVARNLFSQAGAIQRHASSRKWNWAIWPHERRAVCARIVAALSRQN